MRTLRLSLTGTVIDEQDFWNGAPTDYNEQPSGDYQVRGIPVGNVSTDSDPRLSGAWTWDLNEDCFADGGCVNWGTVEAVGPDGTWSGWYAGTERPDTMTYQYRVLVGAGDYEGLTRIDHMVGPFAGPFETHGVTYEGDPPPMLDMDVPPAD